MAEEKKKQFRKVVVNILVNGNVVGTEHYRIIVPPDSTTEKEIEWRLDYLKADPEYSWQIESDELKKRYKMVDNSEAIKNLMHFEIEGDVYYVQVITGTSSEQSITGL